MCINSVLSRPTKQAVMIMKYYQFKQRLVYKCNATQTYFMFVNEKYTSKTCSVCGNNYKKNLKGEKIYKCNKCNMIMARDMNGCRNIYY